MKLAKYSAHRKFSHIYIENDARDYPDTHAVQKRFPKATVIPIRHYKEVFNRSRQNWLLQKSSQKLILAKRRDEFLYKGSHIAPHFSHEHFYYNALTLNCLYNCHYCYLQGMYPSAHTVLFVNNDDYLLATKQKLNELGSLYLCISYDTDLLAFEGLLPQAKRWIEFTAKHDGLTIEIRTKSVNINSLKELKPVKNVILAWTLSPQKYIEQFEELTPSLDKRLEALRTLATLGWKVRICIDPILALPGWQEEYNKLIQYIFSQIEPRLIHDISIGFFRMPERYFKNVKKVRTSSPLFYNGFDKTHGTISYSLDKEKVIRKELLKTLSSYYPTEKVYLV